MASYKEPREVKCYLAPAASAPLIPGSITRRACAPHDVVIDIKYAGICHTDIHRAREDWKAFFGPTNFPL